MTIILDIYVKFRGCIPAAGIDPYPFEGKLIIDWITWNLQNFQNELLDVIYP